MSTRVEALQKALDESLVEESLTKAKVAELAEAAQQRLSAVGARVRVLREELEEAKRCAGSSEHLSPSPALTQP